MRFTVLNWNIGGAKFLETEKRKERKRVRDKINHNLKKIINDHKPQPDVITLQEIVQYKEPSDPTILNLLDDIKGYYYFPFILINTNLLSSKAKWNKILNTTDWNKKTYFAQGNAFLIKKHSPHFPVWDLSNLNQKKSSLPVTGFIEKVHLDSGLYFGDRNTEPRAALVAHFIYNPFERGYKKPLDIFVVNLHLTTLMMEREGVPSIDATASEIRQSQLNVVFDGIVSRYNRWKQSGYLERDKKRKFLSTETKKRHSPVWIITGDFNFTEESLEYAFIKRMNFVDTVPDASKEDTTRHKGTKAKGVGEPPSMTLDYIFAGPKFVSFDPAIKCTNNNVLHEIKASDHYPVLSSMDIIPL